MARLRKAAGNGIIPNLYYASLLNPKKILVKKGQSSKKTDWNRIVAWKWESLVNTSATQKKEQEKKRKSDADLRRTLGMARAWPKIQETVERTVGRMRPAHFPRPPNESR